MGLATSYVNCKQRNLYYLQNKTINCRIAKLLSWNNEQIEYLKRKMKKKYVIYTEEGYNYYKKKKVWILKMLNVVYLRIITGFID